MGLYFGHIGIRENKMETTIEGLGFRIQGFRVKVCDLGGA